MTDLTFNHFLKSGRSFFILSLTFEPGLHVHYESTVLRIKDGLPKMKDVPAEMGGSGETLPE